MFAAVPRNAGEESGRRPAVPPLSSDADGRFAFAGPCRLEHRRQMIDFSLICIGCRQLGHELGICRKHR